MKLYSIKLLLESIVEPLPDLVPGDAYGKTFEETIVLLRTASRESIEEKIRTHFVDDTYENALGGMTTWRFVTILDVYELVDELEGDLDFKEVYSRYLPFDRMMTAGEVIALYSLDK